MSRQDQVDSYSDRRRRATGEVHFSLGTITISRYWDLGINGMAMHQEIQCTELALSMGHNDG
jgi:hypothetical protein